jgi:hypothetical protein
MRKDFKWGSRALVMAVLTMAVSLSERAQAQQTGLFPLGNIRRERPPCPNEDPVYKYYKQQYFGYHYTCWRPFPNGWGCPSKETADKEKAFRDKPLGEDPEMGEVGAEPDDFRGQPLRPTRPGRPALPQDDRDPFEPDGPAALPPGRGQTPRATPRRDGGASPFEKPFDNVPQGASASPLQRSGRARTASPVEGEDAPELSAPMGQPEQNTSARSSRRDADDETAASGDTGPLLAVEDLDAPRPNNAGTLFDSQPIQPPMPVAAPEPTNPPAPPRRGLISNLFGGLGLNWLRR